MKELRTLNLSETNIADYSPLSQLPALQTVFVQTSAQARSAKAAVAGRKQHVSVLKMGSVLTDIISYFIT
jgi:hypothetical protein